MRASVACHRSCWTAARGAPSSRGIGEHRVARMTAADAGRLHPPRGREVGRPEAHPLHPRRGGGDLLDVRHAERRLEDRVDEDRPPQPVAGLELGEQAVDVVDVPRALDLRDHDDGEPVADLADEPHEVVERPRRLEGVDPRPQRRPAEVHLAPDPHEPLARGLLAVGRDGVLEVAEQDVGTCGQLGQLGDHVLVGGVEEMDHPRRRHGDLGERGRARRGQRLQEGPGVAHWGQQATRRVLAPWSP